MYNSAKLVREGSVINKTTQSCFTKIAFFDISYYFCQAQLFNFKLGKTWSVSISFHIVVFRRRNYFIVCCVCRWCHNYGEYHNIVTGKSYLTIYGELASLSPTHLRLTSSSSPPKRLFFSSATPYLLPISPHLLFITSSSCPHLILFSSSSSCNILLIFCSSPPHLFVTLS